MALYAIVGRLGLCGCTRPARGMQSSTCAGIIVMLCARQKSGIFHLKIYGKRFLCLLAAQMYGGEVVGLLYNHYILWKAGDYTGYRVCADYTA